MLGIVERGARLRLVVVDKKAGNSAEYVAGNVSFSSVLMTDNAVHYKGLGKCYAAHFSVDHEKGEYARESFAHTNTIEGAFSHFDRMVIGTYHYVSPKHLRAYLDENTFRYNSRKMSDCGRFNLMLNNSEMRLTYKNLIAK